MNPLYVVNINLIDVLKFATKTLNYSMQLNCDNFVMKPNPAMLKLGMQAIEHGVGGNVWSGYFMQFLSQQRHIPECCFVF